MGKNTEIYKDRITDFTGWGYGVLIWEEFKGSIYAEKYSKYIDRDYRAVIIPRGLFGWGFTAEDAYAKASKILRKKLYEERNISNINKYKHINSFMIYRVSPAAKKYLDTNGFYIDNRGYTDIALIKVPYTIDNTGYPVRYIIDLIDDDIREKLDVPILREIGYKNKERWKTLHDIQATLIKHEIEPIKHRMIKISDIKNNVIKNNELNSDLLNSGLYNYAVYYYNKHAIYGLGSTPEQAFNDAINYIKYIKTAHNEYYDESIKNDFELFFSIRPLSTLAKNYLKAFWNKGQKNTKNNYDFGDKFDGYRFGWDVVKIFPVIMNDGYPVEYPIDLIDKKAIAISKVLCK